MPISDELKGLNSAQYEAVTYVGRLPLLVLAGPGSGKTHTLTKRILYLISNQGISPEKILVLTFTKAAAMEMQNRFATLSEKYHINGMVNFGTFHSVFYAILKQSNQNKAFQMISNQQKKELLIPVIKKYISKEQSQFHGYVSNLSQELLDVISFYQNTMDLKKTIARIPSELKASFELIYMEYETIKRARGYIDFDDMLSACLEMLTNNNELKEYWQNRFSHILIDEFQDINPVQYEMIKILGEKSELFAVGDDDQSIYGFRGSNPACMMRYKKDFHARQILLNVNYRSTKIIVDSSCEMIKENTERFEKTLISNCSLDINKSKEEGDIEIVSQIIKLTDRESQYNWALDYIAHLDIKESKALLFRTNSQMQKMASTLKRLHVTFEMHEKQKDIYQHFIIKDIFAYLKFFKDKKDFESIRMIVNKPSRFVSTEALKCAKSIEELIRYYSDRNESGFHSKAEALKQLLKYRTQLVNKPLYLQITFVRKVIGYDRYLQDLSIKMNTDVLEWTDLLDWLMAEAKNYSDVNQWMNEMKTNEIISGKMKINEKISDKTESDQMISDVIESNPSEQRKYEVCNLHLMTVHASKGLEFDHVIIPDCNERVYPYGNFVDAQILQEERRIFYVAMTRAKKSLRLLYLTGTKESPRQPSRFILRLIRQTHSCPDIHQKHLPLFRTPHRHQ